MANNLFSFFSQGTNRKAHVKDGTTEWNIIERSLEEGKTRFANSDFSQGRCKTNDTSVFRSSRDRYLRTYVQ